MNNLQGFLLLALLIGSCLAESIDLHLIRSALDEANMEVQREAAPSPSKIPGHPKLFDPEP
jgi:hypothetical protein